MKNRNIISLAFVALLLSLLNLYSATYYVWTGSTYNGPGTNWATAFRTIQQAVDVAAPGDIVLVTNGVYEAGGRTVAGGSSLNRVVIQKNITVQSVNGPEVTIIKGQGPIGSSAVRCVYMSAGILSGFTLTNGFSGNSGSDFYLDYMGGGVNAYNGTNVIVSNCVITGCSSYYYGGGVLYGKYYNCIIRSNSAMYGGGATDAKLYNCAVLDNRATQYGGAAYDSELYNCTVVNNSAQRGGGAAYCTVYNSIVYYNQDTSAYPNVYGSSCYYTCTTPKEYGSGNIDLDPQLISDYRITLTSPCRGAGSTNYVNGVDIDGEPWGSPPSMGCDEPVPDSLTGNLSVSIKVPATVVVQSSLEMPLRGIIYGKAASNRWDFGDGKFAYNTIYPAHTWDTTGTVSVVLTVYNDSYPDGVSATTSVRVVSLDEGTCYVWKDSPVQKTPYRSWNEASHSLQLAVEACRYWGGRVLVTNGVYELGGRTTPGGSCYNRVMITNNIIVQSVNGPEFTIIKGQGPIGSSAVRGVFMTDGKLIGFTITNGFTRSSGNEVQDLSGGGICVYGGNNVVISNCIIAGNGALDYGGGVYGGTLYNCIITNNSAQIGGGVSESTCYNSAICANTGSYGGGAYDSTFYNCTITKNSASNTGGGIYSGSLYNCIVWDNFVENELSNVEYGNCSYTCTTPLESGPGNIDVNPQLLTDYRIAPTSPCIGAGSSNYIFGVDVDGDPWQMPPPMGCDQPVPENLTGEIKVAISLPATTVVQSSIPLPISGMIYGKVASNKWDFGDDQVMENTVTASHFWTNTGTFQVVLTAYNRDNPGGVSATATVQVVTIEEGTCLVWANSPNPKAPYKSWSEAARTIQQAIDVQKIWGGIVLVTNGVYESSSRAVSLSLNRVVITNNIIVRSVNGPEVTIIKGQGPLGNSAIRCVYITAGRLEGFTLTNGFTRSSGNYNDYYLDLFGGGANGYPNGGGVLSNCIITGCSAYYGGGGVSRCVLYNCIVINNYAEDYGGGVYDSTLFNCVVRSNSSGYYGGGAYEGAIYNSVVDGNITEYYGGGMYYSQCFNSEIKNNTARYGGGSYSGSISNCVFQSNTASNYGGGCYYGNLYNCILKENKSVLGGGAYGGSLFDCIVAGNIASTNGGGVFDGNLSRCIITNNIAQTGGGSYQAFIENGIIAGNQADMDGGGAAYGTLYNCILSNNVAEYGGGAGGSTMINCLIIKNTAISDGGGANTATLLNCTISDNRAESGGGAINCEMINCISYFNEADYDPNVSDCNCLFTCTTPLQPGDGNIDSDPRFIEPFSGNYRLDSTSPCIDAGTNAASLFYPTDLDGNLRSQGKSIDMGAYEYVAPQNLDSDGDGLPDWWENQYSGSPTGMNSASDDDGDGMDNMSEFIAGTHPFDPSSSLKILEIAPVNLGSQSGYEIKWQSVSGRYYDIEWSWSPGNFSILASNLPATPPENIYTDTSRQISNKKFYRIKIRTNPIR
ncbi:MAG: PKD domain-containing protein [Verrucomicrobiia bacterium]